MALTQKKVRKSFQRLPACFIFFSSLLLSPPLESRLMPTWDVGFSSLNEKYTRSAIMNLPFAILISNLWFCINRNIMSNGNRRKWIIISQNFFENISYGKRSKLDCIAMDSRSSKRKLVWIIHEMHLIFVQLWLFQWLHRWLWPERFVSESNAPKQEWFLWFARASFFCLSVCFWFPSIIATTSSSSALHVCWSQLLENVILFAWRSLAMPSIWILMQSRRDRSFWILAFIISGWIRFSWFQPASCPQAIVLNEIGCPKPLQLRALLQWRHTKHHIFSVYCLDWAVH